MAAIAIDPIPPVDQTATRNGRFVASSVVLPSQRAKPTAVAMHHARFVRIGRLAQPRTLVVWALWARS